MCSVQCAGNIVTCDIPDIVDCANSSQPVLCIVPSQPTFCSAQHRIETEPTFHSFTPSIAHRRESFDLKVTKLGFLFFNVTIRVVRLLKAYSQWFHWVELNHIIMDLLHCQDWPQTEARLPGTQTSGIFAIRCFSSCEYLPIHFLQHIIIYKRKKTLGVTTFWPKQTVGKKTT